MSIISRLYKKSMSCMYTKVWLLVNMNDTQRNNVFNKFKANKMNFIEYDQIIVPIHVNNNHL